MLLAIDVGNTQTSFGLFSPQGLVTHWRAATRAGGTEDELGAFFLPLLADGRKRGELPDDNGWQCAVASVVPGADDAIARFARRYLGVEPWFLTPQESGIEISVESPGTVGADRLANAAYAIERLSLPAIVIDIGTATTFDVLDAQARYMGGAILPGPRMAASTLGMRTAKLPQIALRLPERAIGRSTVECLESGLVLAYLDGLVGLSERMTRELGQRPSIALTGGDGALFADALAQASKGTVHYVPSLTLEGLALLHARRIPKERS